MKRRRTIKFVAILCSLVIIVTAVTITYSMVTHENPLTAILPDVERNAEPEKLVKQYFDGIKAKDYERLYDMLSSFSKERISKDEFAAKHRNIYDGIEAKKLELKITDTSKEKNTAVVSYSVRMDTVAGEIRYENRITLLKDMESGAYFMDWSPSAIFPNLTWSDKIRVNVLIAKRGEIFDCNGVMLAGEGTASSIGLVPGKMRDTSKEADIAEIAELLDMSTSSIKKKLAASWVKEDSFVPLKMVSKDAQELKDAVLQVPGILITDAKVRYYPLGMKASHLIGYIQNINAEELETLQSKGYHRNSVLGKAGLERIYEEQLRAKDGAEIIIVDSSGNEKEVLARVSEVDGSNLHLTLDAEIQSKLYDQFAQDKSCSVAINPKTGAVLALVSTPTYDANDFVLGMSSSRWNALNEDENKPMYNRFKAAQCPGSTMKGVTAAIGLDTGIISPSDDFGPSGRRWQKDGSWGGYSITTLEEYSGPANIENALIYSDNIFFGKAALKIGGDTFAKELKRIGFEERIPFEYGLYSSIISNTEDFSSEIQLADSGFGQGQILVNPVHLAVIYASFINDGNILRPQLINTDFVPDVWIENAFTSKTASIMKNNLIQVVERGTAAGARIPGVTLAGKTGTAEIKLSQADTSGTELGWFVLFTAEENAKQPLLVITMVEDVKNRGGSHYVVPRIKPLFE